MEISAMLAQFRSDANGLAGEVAKQLDEKQLEAKRLRLQLGAIEEEIRKLTEYSGAIRKITESCGLLGDDAPETPVSKHPVGHSRRPRRIGKYDPDGKKIGEYPSINQAAKALGWGHVAMAKYLNTVEKDKQIRLRGFYLEYIAA